MSFLQRERGAGALLVFLLIGAIGGALVSLTAMPLPWLIGSLFAASAARLSLSLPEPWNGGRNVGQLILGATVALAFTPDVLSRLMGLLPVMVVAAVASIVMASAIAVLLTRMTRVDSATAYCACMPGGIAEMSNLADLRGGNGSFVAIAQSIRIILVVIIIPVAMYVTADELLATPDLSAGGRNSLGVAATCLVLAAGCVGSLMFARLGMINSWFLGALVVVATLAATETAVGVMPPAMSAAGQVLIGSALGARLDSTQLRIARTSIPAFAFGTLVLIFITAAFACLLEMLVPLDIWTLVLGVAPGGIAEMSITADVLGAGVAAVTAFHIFRVLVIVGFSDVIYVQVFRRIVRCGRG